MPRVVTATARPPVWVTVAIPKGHPLLPRSRQDIRLRGVHPLRRDDPICHGHKLSVMLTRIHNIDELGETEREVIGIWRRPVYSSAELSNDTSLSYACINVDTAALQIESAICPRFRGFKSTS